MYFYIKLQRRTREIDEGMTKMRFLKSLTQDSGTVLTPDSPSPGITMGKMVSVFVHIMST